MIECKFDFYMSEGGRGIWVKEAMIHLMEGGNDPPVGRPPPPPLPRELMIYRGASDYWSKLTCLFTRGIAHLAPSSHATSLINYCKAALPHLIAIREIEGTKISIV